jgi:Cu/Ag efflux protein CusF
MHRSIRISTPGVLLLVLLCSCSRENDRRDPHATDAPKSYIFRGTPLGIDTGAGSVTIDHERIDGYMEPMTMAFKLADPALAGRITIGRRMRFTLEVAYNRPRITNVEAIADSSGR